MRDNDPLKLRDKDVRAAIDAGYAWARKKYPFSVTSFDQVTDQDTKDNIIAQHKTIIRAFLRSWLS